MPVSDPATASALDVAFHPRSLAVAGVSPNKRGWGGGMMFYQAAKQMGRVEQVYRKAKSVGKKEKILLLYCVRWQTGLNEHAPQI